MLRRIFECAKEEKCDLLLIAGDLFDSRFVSEETGELFCSLVEESNAFVVLSPGNHDPYSTSSFYAKAQKRLGDKLVLFTSPELQVFDIDSVGVRIFGYAFTSMALTESPLAGVAIPADDGYLRIFCGHADIFSPVSRYAPITVDELRRFNFDYAALGHVHNKCDEAELDGRVRYCGFGEGRSFDEIGEGGVWIVEVCESSFACERKILSKRAFYLENVQVGADDDVASLRTKICLMMREKAYGEGAYIRFTLEGIADDALVRGIRSLAGEISSECGIEFLEIHDATMPIIDGEYLERDTTLRGALYRTLRPKLVSADNEERKKAIRALKIGLAAIDGKSIFAVSEKGGHR